MSRKVVLLSAAALALACSGWVQAYRAQREVESGEKIVLQEGWAVYGSGLYLANINKQHVEEIVYLPSHLDSPALFHREDRVLFIRNDSVWGGESGRELWSVDLDGKNLHRIDLALPEARR